MKKLFYHFVAIAGLVYALTACMKNQIKDEVVDLPEYFTITYEQTPYSIHSSSDLNAFIHDIAGEEKLEILEASLKKFLDEAGEFYAIDALYNKDGVNVVMVIPLIEVGVVSKTISVEFIAECTMKCTAQTGCTRCDQTIHERCKRQTCDCGAGNNGCTASMTF